MLKSKQFIVLTGAGFTKNFNGFLATEMWSKIFNDLRVQQSDKLRELLQKDGDYESIYHRILNEPGYTINEKETIKEVIESIYKKLDDSVRSWVFNHENPTALDVYKLWSELFRLFSGDNKEFGLFFTLNQDLLIERRWGWRSPGVPSFNQDFYSLSGKEFLKTDYIKLLSENVNELINRGFQDNSEIQYIKLHGSYGWKSSDGSNQMVIGKNKEIDIEKEPLLKEYFRIFQETIFAGDKKLLIIGYGFGDMHINKILLKGVEEYNLKIYIISTSSFQDLKTKLEFGHFYALNIMKGIRGYFPYSLREIFPPNQEGSVHISEIKETLLNT